MTTSCFAGAPAWPWRAFLSLFAVMLLAIFVVDGARDRPEPDISFVGEHRSDIDRAHRRIGIAQDDMATLRRQFADLEEKVAAFKSCACKPVDAKAAEPVPQVHFTVPIIIPFLKIVREEKTVHMPAPVPPAPERVELLAPIYFIPDAYDCWPRRRR